LACNLNGLPHRASLFEALSAVSDPLDTNSGDAGAYWLRMLTITALALLSWAIFILVIANLGDDSLRKNARADFPGGQSR
jgi:hypothetical protein